MSDMSLRDMMGHRRLKLGTMVIEFDVPGIGQALKAAGCEYAFVDMEHSGFGIESVRRMVKYMQAAELPAFVRPPSKEYHHIARALDVGAEGLMLPMVASGEEARRIVDFMKYAPTGHRGVALGIAHDRYRPGPVMEKLERANRRTCCIALIETAEGVRNVEAIARTDGVDALWIGHFDLTCSLGIPGQFDHKDFRRAVDKALKAAKKARKPIGRLVGSVEEGVAMSEAGFDLICYSGDVFLLQAALGQGLAELRRRCG